MIVVYEGVETQGSFAPERLPNVEYDTVHVREVTDGKFTYTLYASPIIPDKHDEYHTSYIGPIPDDGYQVEGIIETKYEDGETIDYEFEYVSISSGSHTVEEAMKLAEEWTKTFS